MYNVNLFELKDEILKLAAEKPDFVYTKQGVPSNGCSYVGASMHTEGGEGCIIGQALMRLGVSETGLREWESGYSTANSIGRLLYDAEFITVTEMDNHLIDAIQDTQAGQDTGCSWGEAVISLKTFAKVTSSV